MLDVAFARPCVEVRGRVELCGTWKLRTRVNSASRTCEVFTTLADLRTLRRIRHRAIERSDGAAWYLVGHG